MELLRSHYNDESFNGVIMVDIYCERLLSTTSTALLETMESLGLTRMYRDSAGNSLDRWWVLSQNGTASPVYVEKSAIHNGAFPTC